MKRTFLYGVISLVTGLLFTSMTSAADFPTKNITIIVAASPGGGFDRLARAIGRSMKKNLPKDVSVIVKNIPGAGNITGTVAMYRAKPDGYTLGHLYTDGMMGMQMMRGAKRAGYDVTKFTYLARVGAEPYSVLTSKNSPYKTLDDLKKAKNVKWGVEGIGVSRWIPSFITAKELGIDFHVVSGYGGTGQALPALIRGDFDAFLQPIDHPATVNYLKSGEIRPIVHLGESRAKNAPDTPTARESGTDLVLVVGRSIVAPPGLSQENAKILEKLFVDAMNDQDYQDFIAKSGAPLVAGDAAQANKDLENFEKVYTKYTEPMREALKQK
jgi:tripartite-type tricarboxylate transporter receptor subunit TctC